MSSYCKRLRAVVDFITGLRYLKNYLLSNSNLLIHLKSALNIIIDTRQIFITRLLVTQQSSYLQRLWYQLRAKIGILFLDIRTYQIHWVKFIFLANCMSNKALQFEQIGIRPLAIVFTIAYPIIIKYIPIIIVFSRQINKSLQRIYSYSRVTSRL
jgi:hypothetical protein